MASIAGYKTVLRKTGTPTAMTSEVMAATTVNNQYQITSTARRIWDRTASFTFKTSADAAISAGTVSDIDYLFGKVTFASSQGTAPQVTGTYLPASAISGSNSYSLTLNNELLDDTDFSTDSNGSYRSRLRGIKDASATITRWAAIDTNYFDQILDTSGTTTLVLEFRPGNSSIWARGFFKLFVDDQSGDVGGLETGELSFELDASTELAFKWSDQ